MGGCEPPVLGSFEGEHLSGGAWVKLILLLASMATRGAFQLCSLGLIGSEIMVTTHPYTRLTVSELRTCLLL